MVSVASVHCKIKASDTVTVSFLNGGGFNAFAWMFRVIESVPDRSSYGEEFERPLLGVVGRCVVPHSLTRTGTRADVFFKRGGKVEVAFEAQLATVKQAWLLFCSDSLLYVGETP